MSAKPGWLPVSDQIRIGGVILQKREADVPWKILEVAFSRDRSTLWRWAQLAAAETYRAAAAAGADGAMQHFSEAMQHLETCEGAGDAGTMPLSAERQTGAFDMTDIVIFSPVDNDHRFVVRREAMQIVDGVETWVDLGDAKERAPVGPGQTALRQIGNEHQRYVIERLPEKVDRGPAGFLAKLGFARK